MKTTTALHNSGSDAPLTGESSRSLAEDRALLRMMSVPAMTLFVALCAQIAIPMEPLGVPLTLQTLGVLLCALLLGPKLGTMSMALYYLTGMLGVGVFADGEAGLITILGQTGGYLIGFMLCQPVAHWMIRRKDRSIRGWLTIFLAGLVIHAIIFAIGVPWLWMVRIIDTEATTLTLNQAFQGGCVVFLPGAFLKSGIATGVACWAIPSVSKRLW